MSRSRAHEDIESISLVCAASNLLRASVFAAAALRLPLSMIGLMQYLAPTIQFLLGVFVYDEPFDSQRLIGFTFIWVALAVFTAEGLAFARSERRLS